MCLQLRQSIHQVIDVVSGTIWNDVDVKGCERRALNDRGDAAYNHEAHVVAPQRRQDRGEVSRSSSHGAPYSPD